MQTNFFDIIDAHENMIKVAVHPHGDHYYATIDNWWMATGKTEKEAVKKVVAAYENEVYSTFLERS